MIEPAKLTAPIIAESTSEMAITGSIVVVPLRRT